MRREGLIFNIFEHSFNENCPLAVVNASHFLPCKLQNIIRRSFAK
jgi:hypothetical protein